MLKNSLVFVTISDTMINLFMFVPIYMLTRGGPEGTTNTLMYEAYRSAFKYSNYNRSYAIITILLLLTFIIVGIQFKLMSDREPSARQKKGGAEKW
jgi:ABC-type sugar transport system permease subunit